MADDDKKGNGKPDSNERRHTYFWFTKNNWKLIALFLAFLTGTWTVAAMDYGNVRKQVQTNKETDAKQITAMKDMEKRIDKRFDRMDKRNDQREARTQKSMDEIKKLIIRISQ